MSVWKQTHPPSLITGYLDVDLLDRNCPFGGGEGIIAKGQGPNPHVHVCKRTLSHNSGGGGGGWRWYE